MNSTLKHIEQAQAPTILVPFANEVPHLSGRVRGSGGIAKVLFRGDIRLRVSEWYAACRSVKGHYQDRHPHEHTGTKGLAIQRPRLSSHSISLRYPAPLCYFALSESSVQGATPGKRLLGLRVTDMVGNGIGFDRAFLRTIVKLIPWEVAHLSLFLPTPIFIDEHGGFLPGLITANVLIVVYLVVIVMTNGKQGVHDLVARTIVQPRSPFGREEGFVRPQV
jgi:RDD family